MTVAAGERRVVALIPAYLAADAAGDVVASALAYVDDVVLVDDGCPENTGDAVLRRFADEPCVHVVRRATNGGVGAAVKSGIEYALELDATVIIKLDADGQMDPAYIPSILEALESDPTIVLVKGNRFTDAAVLSTMPRVRFFGNAVLSLLVKFSSGYWNLLDPTNGYLAFNARYLPELPWREFADSYFFEISVLCKLGLRHAHIAELDMRPIYGQERSSLSIKKVLKEFPPRLFRAFVKRLILQYFVFDINPGSLYLLFGTFLTLIAVAIGGYEWYVTLITHVARTTGTVMLAVLPFLMGFQLLLNALMYDVQFTPSTTRDSSFRQAPGRTPSSRALR